MKNKYMFACMEYDVRAICHFLLEVVPAVEVKYIGSSADSECSYDYELRIECEETQLVSIGMELGKNTSVCWWTREA